MFSAVAPLVAKGVFRLIRRKLVRRLHRGAKHSAAGMGVAPIPWRQAQRAAPQTRRREGLKPNGRDSEDGTGRSSKAGGALRRNAHCIDDRLRPYVCGLSHSQNIVPRANHTMTIKAAPNRL